MNHNIKQMFVVKSGQSLLTSGTTADLAEGQVGVFKQDYTALAAAPSPSASPYIYIAEGSGNTEFGSFKTSKVYLNKVTSWRGFSADTTGKEQITYVGWDEINDTATPGVQCDKSYTLVIRVFEHYLRSVYCPYLQEGVVVKSACCADCSTNCDDLDAMPIFEAFATKINENPRLSQYVSASVVSKLISGSAPTTTFAIVLPDPGTHLGGVTDVTASVPGGASYTAGTYTGVTGSATSGSGTSAAFTIVTSTSAVTSVTVTTAGSGYAIGDTITISTGITGLSSPAEDITLTVTETSGAEGSLLGAVRDFYASKVANAETDIVFSSDSDASDGDANSTGNVMIEMVPSAGVTLADIEPYNGVAWFDVTAASTAVYAVGLKLVGTTPTGFNAPDCIPDAIPYLANKVRFKAYAGEAPSSSQLEDMFDFCNLWEVKDVQTVKYPIGEGVAIAELERNYAGYNQPQTASHRYFIPFYNGDFITFADKTLTYDIYELEYLDPSSAGFEHKTAVPMSIMIAVPSTESAWKSSFEGILNTYLANSPASFPSVTL